MSSTVSLNHLDKFASKSSFHDAVKKCNAPSTVSWCCQKIKDHSRFIPITLPIIGSVCGTLANYAVHGSIYAKGFIKDVTLPPAFCAVRLPLLSHVNDLRQYEIANIPFPVIPAVIIGSTLLSRVSYKLYYRDEEVVTQNGQQTQKKISALSQIVKEMKALPFKELVSSTALLILAVATKKLLRPADKNVRDAFNHFKVDPSGHVMVKGAIAYGTINSMKYANTNPLKVVGSALTALSIAYSVTDIYYMLNTSYCYHTTADIITGAVAAAALTAAIEVAPKVIACTANKISSIATLLYK